MARYWVGGTGDWDASTTTHWSASSGGAGGQSVPASTDDVLVDGSSGTGTITQTAIIYAKSISFAGYTGTFTAAASGNINIYGSLTVSSGMTYNTGAVSIQFVGGTPILTTNGKTIDGVNCGVSGTVTLGDALNCLSVNVGAGCTLNTANYAINAISMFLSHSTATLTLGSSVVTLSGSNNVWNNFGPGTITASSSTIKCINASATVKTFVGGDKTYNNLWLSGAGTGNFTITGSNTFADIKVDTPPHTVNFTAGTTTTVTTFTVGGTDATHKMTLQSTSAGSAWNLSCASGTINCNWLSLKDSHATGGATFNATNSTDVSGNTGWNITAPPSFGSLFFGSNF